MRRTGGNEMSEGRIDRSECLKLVRIAKAYPPRSFWETDKTKNEPSRAFGRTSFLPHLGNLV